VQTECLAPIHRQSRRHPLHDFKIGYFFSLSNRSGFNNVLRKLTGEDFYTILGFKPSTPDTFKPEWKRIKEKVGEIHAKLRHHKEVCGGFHNVHAIRRTTSQPKTEQEALEIFRSEVKRCREGEFDLGNFTSEKGEFLLSCPWKVVSIIPADLENQTVCCYIIVEEDLLWYIDGLDIIEETVDFVLSQSDREVFRLCWSD
jgi:hypothetical protein